MIGKVLLAGLGVAAGAAVSPETKGKIGIAARGLRDDLGAATKGPRDRVAREWGRFKRFVREEILDEDPPRRPASPTPSA